MGKTPAGKYLYCVVDLQGNAPTSFLGAEETKVIRCRDIGAVVKDSPLLDFGGMDEGELMQRIAHHQRVNEAVMEKGISAPMRFGIVAQGEDEVKSLLDRAYLQLKTSLARVRGKAEFGAHVHWHEGPIVQEIGARDERVQSLKNEMAQATADRQQTLKIALGEAVHVALVKRRDTYLNEVRRVLRKCSTHWALGMLREDTMIANLAFLVEKDKGHLFEASLKQLGERYEGRLRFKCIGPLPPYSFCDIHLSVGSFELIDGARKTLGLGEEACLDGIKTAYRKLAVRYHPDRNPEIYQSAERFKEIVSAYETLVTYCRNYRCSFRRETVEGSISLTSSNEWKEEGELCAEGRSMVEALKYGKYIYCLIGTKRTESFGPIGMGRKGDDVHTVHYRDLAAVVSDSPVIKYPVSRENCLIHQRAIEKVNERHTVLPVRYGTIADSEDQVPRFLMARYDEFKSALRYMEDKVELGVKAVWKNGVIFREIARESPEIQRLKARMANKPLEKTYYQRIQIGERVEAALETKRQKESKQILGVLNRHSLDHRLNRNLHERMVLNAAFLVRHPQQEAFDEAMNRLAEKCGPRMEFRYVGPVPPFNFVEIFIDFDELKAAKAS